MKTRKMVGTIETAAQGCAIPGPLAKHRAPPLPIARVPGSAVPDRQTHLATHEGAHGNHTRNTLTYTYAHTSPSAPPKLTVSSSYRPELQA